MTPGLFSPEHNIFRPNGQAAGILGGLSGLLGGQGSNPLALLNLLGGRGNGSGGLDLSALLGQLGGRGNGEQNPLPKNEPTDEEPLYEGEYYPAEPASPAANASPQEDAWQNAAAENEGWQNPPAEDADWQNPPAEDADWQSTSAREEGAAGTTADSNPGTPDLLGLLSQIFQQTQARQTAPPPAAEPATAPPSPTADPCRHCQRSCPHAGLRLPSYSDVAKMAAGWQRY